MGNACRCDQKPPDQRAAVGGGERLAGNSRAEVGQETVAGQIRAEPEHGLGRVVGEEDKAAECDCWELLGEVVVVVVVGKVEGAWACHEQQQGTPDQHAQGVHGDHKVEREGQALGAH